MHHYPFTKIAKNISYKGAVYAFFASLSGAVAVIVLKKFYYLPSLQITALWLFLGSIMSLSINFFEDKEKRVINIIKKQPGHLLLQSLFSTLSAFCFIFGISLLEPSSAVFIHSAVFIIACIIMGRFFFNDKLSFKHYISFAGGILGLVFLSGSYLFSSSVLGVLFMALSGIFLSIAGLLVKKYFKPTEAFPLNALRSFIGGVIIIIPLLLSGSLILPLVKDLPLMFLGIIMGNVLQFTFQYKAYDLAKLEVVSTVHALSPFMVILLALLFLGTLPSFAEFLGGLVMFTSTFYLIMLDKK